MILHGLARNLREQNWTAIAIEFVLLVLGVFLGIQVSNWNAERENRQQSIALTARLKADLRMESWRYQSLLEYSRDVRAAAERAEDALSGKATLSNEAFLVNAYRATQYRDNSGADRRQTYDELVATGGVGLITDRELWDNAAGIYNTTIVDNLVKEGTESRYRELFRMSVPTEVQRALSKQCGDRQVLLGDYRDIDKVIDYPCKTGLPEDVTNAAAEALRSDPQTLRLLRLRIANLDTRLYDMTVTNRDGYEFLLAIARETP